MKLPQPYLLFLGDVTLPLFAKTAFGLRDWAPELCIGELALPGCTVTTGLPRLTPGEARARGARALIIGVASIGGALAPQWLATLVEALEAGLDLVSGMHGRLADNAQLAEVAQRRERQLIDVRCPPQSTPLGSGRKRLGKRLLTVGSDCAVGKKYTALSLTQEFRRLGVDADFRATGQTGILIAGEGIPIDAVIADFVAGAAEELSPDAPPDHWDIVEGQGSVIHPSYAGVSLGLLHGTQPDVIVLCHEHGREHIAGLVDYRIPSLQEVMDLTLTLARRTNSDVRCGGISVNTSKLDERAARAALATYSDHLRLPAADPLRGGPEFEGLARACLDGLLPRPGIRQALSDGSSKREPTLEREFVSRHAMKGDAV